MWPPEMEERKPAATDSAVEFDRVKCRRDFHSERHVEACLALQYVSML